MQRNFIRKYACNYFALVLVFPLELYFSRTFIPFKQFFLFTALELEYPVPEPRKTSSQFSRSQVSDLFFIDFFTFQFEFQGLKFSILFYGFKGGVASKTFFNISAKNGGN